MPVSIRKLILAALGVSLCQPGGSAPATMQVQAVHEPAQDEQAPVTLTLPQARALAQDALQKGQPKLAFTLSEGLLQANPNDGHAHFTQALALARMKDFQSGKRSAAKAYRVAQSDDDRYHAAELAARLSFADERFTQSQLWLRRAVQYAPDEASRDQTITSFRNVRRHNPLNFNLRFSVTPSDNVNNGSNSPYNVIEGSPLVGTLSPSAQAIAGIVATGDLQGSYRIASGERFETRLTGRVYSRRVEFNNPVAGLSGSDLSSVRLEAGLSHLLSSGESGHYWRFTGKGGRVWYGGDPLYDFISAGAERSQKLNDKIRLSFGGSVEEQFDQLAPIADATVFGAFAGLTYALPDGGSLGARIQYRSIDSNGANRASEQWTGIASYVMGKQIGPAKMSFSVGYSTLDYDTYTVIGPVAGGRLDESYFGGVTASFNDWGYMGFVPTLSVRAEKSRSNISRFDVDQTSVSLGIRSEF